jgi:phage terminase large subunit-like protein
MPDQRSRAAGRAAGPADNLEPAKDNSTERIDGIVATIMAIGRAMLVQED